MNDKEKVQKKITGLLWMILGRSTKEEKFNAVDLLIPVLPSLDLDIDTLIERVVGGEQLTAAEVQAIYERGYAQGHADGAEQGRRSAVIAAAMPMNTFGSIGSGSVGSGINGYSWFEVAQYCATNKHRVSRDKDREFLDSIFEQIAYRQKTPSPPQAKWLTDIFNQRFGGRID
jgi:hypothetical protein